MIIVTIFLPDSLYQCEMKKTQFKKFVARYKDLIYSHAYYFTGNSDDAADITRLLNFVSGDLGQQPAGAWRFPQ